MINSGAVLLGRAARLTVDDEVAVYFAECDEREFGSEVLPIGASARLSREAKCCWHCDGLVPLL